MRPNRERKNRSAPTATNAVSIARKRPALPRLRRSASGPWCSACGSDRTNATNAVATASAGGTARRRAASAVSSTTSRNDITPNAGANET